MKQIEASPQAYGKLKKTDGSFSYEALNEARPIPWDGVVTKRSARSEGSNTLSEAERKTAAVRNELQEQERANTEGELPTVDDLEVEPALTAEQYGYPLSKHRYLLTYLQNQFNRVKDWCWTHRRSGSGCRG